MEKRAQRRGANVWFECPGCKSAHRVVIEGPEPWGWNGSEERPTFTPSVLCTWEGPKGYSNDNPAPKGYDGPMEEHRCHSFVTDGKIQFLTDSTHELAGQTVDLPEWGKEW